MAKVTGTAATFKAAKIHRGMTRPKKLLNFQAIAKSQIQQPVPATADTLSAPAISAAQTLGGRICFLDLIIRRNKNQHRAQPFFKYLCLLRRSLSRLLVIYNSLAALTKSKVIEPQEVRRKFEQEAQLRSRREVVEEHLREVLVPRCWVRFSNVVTDSQFANLGIVLLGVLAEVAAGAEGTGLASGEGEGEHVGMALEDDVVERRRDTELKSRRLQVDAQLGTSVLSTSTRITGEDQGEIIQRRYEQDDGQGVAGSMNGALLASDDKFGTPSDAESHRVRNRKDSMHIMTATSDAVCQSLMKEPGEVKADKRTPSKKVKKRKNAIDDLFSSLL